MTGAFEDGGATVSFIVPTLNSARTLEACLTSLRAQEGACVEVVVVDNGSEDGTVEVARRLADVFLSWGPERSAQRNRGLAAAAGLIVGFIDSDMVLEPYVAAEALECFASHPDVGAIVVDENVIGSGFLSGCRQLEKEVRRHDPAAEAARLFRRVAVEAVGGFCEDLYAGEDWDLADRVSAAGWDTSRLSSVIWHDEGRITLEAAFRKKVYYGRNFVRYASMPRSQRRRLVQGRLLSDVRMLRSPLRAGGLLALKSAELAGFVCGGVLAGREQRRAS